MVTSVGTVRAAISGNWPSSVLTTAGQVWMWGDNGYGQLGDGTGADRLVPGRVPSLPGMRGLGSGWTHLLAIAADHGGWAWGRNDEGQVGNGTTTVAATPVQIFPAGTFEGCALSHVAPNALTIDASGGTRTFQVFIAPQCAWTAATDSTFVHLASGGATGIPTVQVTIDEYTGTTARTATLTLAGKTVTITQGDVASTPAPNEVISYVHTDALGSVRMLTDAAGEVVARYDSCRSAPRRGARSRTWPTR